MSKTTPFARARPDGTVVQVLEDGSEQPFPETPMRSMTDAEVHAAAMKDPDARPMTDAEWHAARKVPRAKTLRRALGLTQEEFAARFQIPIGTRAIGSRAGRSRINRRALISRSSPRTRRPCSGR
jgi:putative transcriptional regulator